MAAITVTDLLSQDNVALAAKHFLAAEAYGFGREAVISIKRHELGDDSEKVVRTIERMFADDFLHLAKADMDADPCFGEYASKVALALSAAADAGMDDQQHQWLCSLGIIALGVYWRWTPTISADANTVTCVKQQIQQQRKLNKSDDAGEEPTMSDVFNHLRNGSLDHADKLSLFDLYRRGCGPAVGGSKERAPLLRFLLRKSRGIPSDSLAKMIWIIMRIR